MSPRASPGRDRFASVRGRRLVRDDPVSPDAHARSLYNPRMNFASPHAAWQHVTQFVTAPGLEGSVEVRTEDVPHPAFAGATASIGLWAWQTEDWRFPPSLDCRGVHVQLLGDIWRVHIDRRHPACGPVEHVRQDAPRVWSVGWAAIGTLLGAMLDGKRGATIGGMVGLGVGLKTRGV
jgi:hypothetical protein